MSIRRSCPAVAIAGAGAAGTLTAAHLARGATEVCRNLELLLVDPRPSTGAGTAYSTRDIRHRLNVRAGGMSAWPDDPDHFVRWLRTERDPATEPTDFVPRADYAGYLAAVLDDAVAQSGGSVRLDRRYERATTATPHGRRVRLGLGATSARAVDAAVLAIGSAPPGIGWAPKALVRSPRFVADPWAAGALARIDAGGPVLLVGTGLTMVDVVLTLDRPGRMLHAVSRHGLLPAVHADAPLPSFGPPALPDGPLGLAALRQAIRAHLAAAETIFGDWRPAVDSLRPVTAAVWGRLSEADRAEFLRRDARWWEVGRHRIPPEVGRHLTQLSDDGRLEVHTAEVGAVVDHGDELSVTLTDGTELRVTAVVNCTGPVTDLRSSGDPLLLDLLLTGAARPGPIGLGFGTDESGRVLDQAGTASPVLWTLGATRRGELWESTAIPEIRAQAATLARGVLDDLSRLRGSRSRAIRTVSR